jgi:hypothetical protein
VGREGIRDPPQNRCSPVERPRALLHPQRGDPHADERGSENRKEHPESDVAGVGGVDEPRSGVRLDGDDTVSTGNPHSNADDDDNANANNAADANEDADADANADADAGLYEEE